MSGKRFEEEERGRFSPVAAVWANPEVMDAADSKSCKESIFLTVRLSGELTPDWPILFFSFNDAKIQELIVILSPFSLNYRENIIMARLFNLFCGWLQEKSSPKNQHGRTEACLG